jgi:hypothetical protein
MHCSLYHACVITGMHQTKHGILFLCSVLLLYCTHFGAPVWTAAYGVECLLCAALTMMRSTLLQRLQSHQVSGHTWGSSCISRSSLVAHLRSRRWPQDPAILALLQSSMPWDNVWLNQMLRRCVQRSRACRQDIAGLEHYGQSCRCTACVWCWRCLANCCIAGLCVCSWKAHLIILVVNHMPCSGSISKYRGYSEANGWPVAVQLLTHCCRKPAPNQPVRPQSTSKR